MTDKIAVHTKGYVRKLDVFGTDLTVVNNARASYDKESAEMTPNDERLIAFLAREKHMSPFRSPRISFEVYAPLFVARQWWRYAIDSQHIEDGTPWSESCLPASEVIKGWHGEDFTIERLLDLKSKGKLPTVRSVNSQGEIVQGQIEDVWETGVADVFEVESELGFKVRTTDTHRYLTPTGYKPLSELNVGDYIMMNGIPAYKDADWLRQKYVEEGMTQKEIAGIVGCSEHTIRKWVREHGLQQDQVARMLKFNEIHGVFGKGLTNETSDIIRRRSEKMSESSKGVPRPRDLKPSTLSNTGHQQARKLYEKDVCLYCAEKDKQKLEIHHIDKDPTNNTPENIQVLCIKHHNMVHGRQVLLVAHPIKISKITKVSTEKVYDVEVGDYHNFVSNQFILHNSRRYITENTEFYVPSAEEWRSAPANSKQGSGEPVDLSIGETATQALLDYVEAGEELYEVAMQNGICAEQARLFLPAYGLMVRWRWTASLQAITHMLTQRLAHDTQKEFQDYAKAVYELTAEAFPVSTRELMKGAIPSEK